MKINTIKAIGLCVLMCAFQFVGAKQSTSSYLGDASTLSTLKVFFEGRNIDFDYIRRNINFVDFVNEPKAADVHVIVTRNVTGGGGVNYILNFYSQDLTQIGDISLNCISSPGDTEDEIRECITRTLKLGLMPYINETQSGNNIDITYADKNKKPIVKEAQVDQWKQWVFRVDANGGFNLQESRNNYNYSLNFRADKVTDVIKFQGMYWMRNRFEAFKNNGNVITSNNSNQMARFETVYSLSDRWSTGLFVSFFQNSASNTKASYEFKPAIEYNFFPWDESDKRVFTIAYFAGLEVKDYYATTIYGKEQENLWAQNLSLNFEVIQPWGEIETRLEGKTYLDDFTKNRITFNSDFSFRITRGLSLNFDFTASSIHDELWKPLAEYSLEDILLGNVALPSTFRFSGGMGIRIQFGSLYNNVVNNRL